jgi:F-type H+-transporting ATPase subunit gamma
MPSLKEVRTRIDSVNSTKQITSAMKMVSASKLRRAQNAIQTMRPYAAKLQELLQNITATLENSTEGKFTVLRPAEKILLIPVTSNRGLCGAFNANVIRATTRLIMEKFAAQHEEGNLKLYCIGKKGDEFFRHRKYPVVATETSVFDDLRFSNTVAFAQRLMDLFESATYDRIIFVYNQFKNAGTQLLIYEQFLPIELPAHSEDDRWNATDYIYEPDQQQILDELIPKTLKTQVYKILLDSFASEHGARMIAMHKATDNATELLKALKLSYNKARQASITKEILEIVGGANALDG